MMRKLFKISEIPQWKILEKEVVDEIIFRTIKPRNRLILELMARGGMRIGEVLKLTPADVDERKLTLPLKTPPELHECFEYHSFSDLAYFKQEEYLMALIYFFYGREGKRDKPVCPRGTQKSLADPA